ncbi:MAG: hypothetical protein HYU80_04535 [Candidatus Blackburnbacteria bacterium]|nr:hypothetical protein [Candidatus Blackburnbacteria bacterium]
MITPESINQGLMIFYLTGAILLLAMAILVYPTLRERERARRTKKKQPRK